MRDARILICSGQKEMRDVLVTAIEEMVSQADVKTASSGKVGEVLGRRHRFDLIFLDAEMPLQDGFTTLRKLRGAPLSYDTPFVICTEQTDERDLVGDRQSQADFYLTKPFDLDEVYDVLQDVLRYPAAV